MESLLVPTGALIVVCDGSKAIFYRNDGTAFGISLRAENTLEEHHPRAHDLGTDQPGRLGDASAGRRSATEETNWHDVAEERFLEKVAAALEHSATSDSLPSVILAAPPRALGVLRDHLGAATRSLMRAELPKDLVKIPKSGIERYLQAESAAG